MPQARDGAGQFARHLGAGTHLGPHLGSSIDLKGDPVAPDVIATENLIVHDPNLGIDRQLIAGQPVPADLVGPYRDKVGGQAAAQAPGEAARDDAAGEDLEALTVEELQDRADQAGLTVEGTGQGGRVLKSDLVAALQGS